MFSTYDVPTYIEIEVNLKKMNHILLEYHSPLLMLIIVY